MQKESKYNLLERHRLIEEEWVRERERDRKKRKMGEKGLMRRVQDREGERN